MWNIIIMLLIAAVGGILFDKLKMPMGLLVGAMLFVALYNVFTSSASYPPALKLLMQILIGACIGCKIGKKQLLQLKKAIFPTIAVCVFTTVFTLLFGYMVYRFTDFDLPTAFFSIAPGGAADMAIISAEYGANEAYVSIINTLRLMFNVAVFLPLALSILGRKEQTQSSDGPAPEKVPTVVYDKKIVFHIITVFAVASAGGFLFDKVLHVSAGGIIGSMIFGAIYCSLTSTVVMPKWLVSMKQVIQGAYSGSLIKMSVVLMARQLIKPLIFEVFFIVTYTLCTGLVIWRLGKQRLQFSMIVPTPGGIGEIAAVSDALGEDTPTIVVVQTVRLFFVLAILPAIIPLILK
ncbi:MAG: AbrB family transcriptional regulator [Clostridia bacterium]|nr:AbrB family transcriptional regulator [Clostridia bacterium]